MSYRDKKRKLHIAAGTTNATVVKASKGFLKGFYVTNTSGAIKFLKFHNTSAAPTPGSGVEMIYSVPANGSLNIDFGDNPIVFETGIGITMTGAAALADTTAVTAGDLIANIFYE